MTVEWFEGQMRRMAGLRFVPAEMTTHWDALQDLPEAVLEAAVTRAQRSRVEFPTPFELRQDADQVAHLVQPIEEEADRATDLLAPVSIPVPQAAAVIQVRQTWNYYCERCSDSGWESFWCGPFSAVKKPWHAPRICERRGEHGSHEWVRACPCAATNPALVRKRAGHQQYAEQAAKR